jgi:simple sugar transport system ATP-binding protein/D-xylose transport system ATP-binding protein
MSQLAEKIAAGSPIMEVQQLRKSFGGVRVLRGVDLQLRPGEVVGLVGDNGAGKSTLIKALSGNLKADDGEIKFDGRTVEMKDPNTAKELGIQTVHQDLALCDNLDAVQNLFLGSELTDSALSLHRVKRALSESRAREVLRRLRLENISLTRNVGAMSGGQRQNIAIARSLLWSPRVVFFDEPTAALSHSAAVGVGKLIRQLADDGLAVMVVSHDIHQFALEVTDRIVVLRLGRVAAEFDSKKVSGEQVVNAMVGGNESINFAE